MNNEEINISTESSNEEVKTVSRKKIILISLPVVFVILIVILVKVKYSFFNDVKKKIVASSFKCENGYKLRNKKCVVTKEQSFALLGNVNNDDSVNKTDLDVLRILIDGNGFNELSYAASDINHDGIVDDTDFELLGNYVNNSTNKNDIGSFKVCPMDDENSVYHYDQKKDKCVQIVAKDASKKLEQDIILESYDDNTSNIPYNTGSINYNTSTVVTRDSNKVYDPNDTTTYNPYPSTHEYYHSPYTSDTVTQPYSYSTGYNPYYNTNSYNTFYNTIYNGDESNIEDDIKIVDDNASKFLYGKNSLIKIEEVQVPNKEKSYQKKNKLNFKLRVNQQGTGFYYYTVRSYYGSNDYNLGYLNTTTHCQKLNLNGVLDLNMNILENNSRLVLSVYADKDCRSQKLQARYISSKYNLLTKTEIGKIIEKTYKIKEGFQIFVLKPIDTVNTYNYRVRYAISDGSDYYVKDNNECLKVVHGMNQLKESTNSNLDIYSDNKCSKSIKKINLK